MAQRIVYHHDEYLGYQFDAKIVNLELYRLVSIFAASRTLAALQVDPQYSEHKSQLHFDSYAFLESSRLLVSIAAMIRSSLDSNPFEESIHKQEINIRVGDIYEDNEQPDVKKPLLIRDACNKIIHALEIAHVYEDLIHIENPTPPFGPDYLLPQILLFGENRGKPWKVELDVYLFAAAVSKLYPED